MPGPTGQRRPRQALSTPTLASNEDEVKLRPYLSEGDRLLALGRDRSTIRYPPVLHTVRGR
jgi:hypothetical protein